MQATSYCEDKFVPKSHIFCDFCTPLISDENRDWDLKHNGCPFCGMNFCRSFHIFCDFCTPLISDENRDWDLKHNGCFFCGMNFCRSCKERTRNESGICDHCAPCNFTCCQDTGKHNP